MPASGGGGHRDLADPVAAREEDTPAGVGPQPARPFQDHDVSPRMVKGRSMERLAQRVASVVSCRPARWRAPMARFLSAAMARGPERVRTWD